MELVKFFLQKFSNLTLPDDTLKRLFIDIVVKTCGIELDRSQIVFRRGELLVTTSPIVKSELFLRKNQIMKQLEIELSVKAPKNIR